MTFFEKEVYRLVQSIPAGFVTTYKSIAKALGKPKSYRGVGNVLHKNKKLIVVPCHRVVKSDGSVGGFVLGQRKKISLLKKEGVEVNNNKIVNFKKRLYN